MIDHRLPVVAANVAHKLTVECLDRDGFIGRPHWHDLRTGIRPGATHGAEPGKPHGWQCYASSFSEQSFRKNVVFNQGDQSQSSALRQGSSNFGLGETPIASASLRSSMRMRDRLGPTRPAQSCVCSFRTTQNEGNGTREGVGQGVPRGGCDSEVQRKTSRHERGCGDDRLEVATGLPLFFWSPTCSGHCTAVRVGRRWNRASRGSQSRWRCVHQSARGQRNEVFRALEGKQMSPRCGCSRDGGKMERGGPGEFGCRQGTGCSTCNVPLRQVGVAETVASVVVSVLRSFLRQFVGGLANCVACPWWSRRLCP